MFRKPYNLKSQVQLKSSESRKILNQIQTLFPSLTPKDISELSEEPIRKWKMTTFQDIDVNVYATGVTPILIEVEALNMRLPTVFLVWKFPHIVAAFTTNSFVCEKLKLGADLFMPGVMWEGLWNSNINFQKDTAVMVNTLENSSCIGTGLACFDKKIIYEEDMSKKGGVAVKMFHTVGDHLYKALPGQRLPLVGPPAWVLSNEEKCKSSPEECAGRNQDMAATELVQNDNGDVEREDVTGLSEEKKVEDGEVREAELGNTAEDNDVLLEYCLVKALKSAPKTIYPILPATFYAKHVLEALPENNTLNIKKTRWKKFSTYLKEKSLEGVIKLQEIQKNEFKIVGFDASHPQIREFVDIYRNEPLVVPDKIGADGQPVVQQIYSVTAATLPFFEKRGYKKRDEMTRNDVRNAVNEYIKQNELQHPVYREKVVLDPVLWGMLKTSCEEVETREKLLTAMLGQMSVQHKVSNTCSGDTILHKGKMPCIEFELATRTGNKKVTLISNLESFGVDVATFCRDLQRRAAASTSITPVVPGKKGAQILVQGNQIAIAAAMLRERLIQDKFMRGLEKAPKSKKK